MNSMPPAPIFGVASSAGDFGAGTGSKFINIDEIFADCFNEGDSGDLLLDSGGGTNGAENGPGVGDSEDVGVIGPEGGEGADGMLGVTPSVAQAPDSVALRRTSSMGGLNGGTSASAPASHTFGASVLSGLEEGGANGTQPGAVGSGTGSSGGSILPATSRHHFPGLSGFGATGETAADEAAAGLASAEPGAAVGRGGGASVVGGATGGGSLSGGVRRAAGARQTVGMGSGTTARGTGGGRGGGARGSAAAGGGAAKTGARLASAAGLEDDDDDHKTTRRSLVGEGKRPRPGGRNMTEQQRLDRRERNREHAKRSRVRKKFLLESLQKSVTALKEENDKLRDAIRSNLGADVAKELLEQTDTTSVIASSPGEATKVLDDPDYSLVKALQTAQQNFVITDPTLPDNPIVFASQGFLELTGYRLDQVLGRNCRFLQGPDTDPKAVERIRKAIESGMDTSVCLRNYRVDGAMFWNQFFIAALRDSEGSVINYVGVQCKVDEDFVRAIQKKNAEEEGEEDEEVDDEDRSDGDDKTT